MSQENSPSSSSPRLSSFVIDGFSIREYTMKMRSKGVEKCWPFDENDTEKEDLPPMNCNKFGWWKKEYDEVKSATQESRDQKEKQDDHMVCPVCGSFKAHRVKALNKHVNLCLIKLSKKDEKRKVKKNTKVASSSSKSKSPKKRSMVELIREEDEAEEKGDEEEKENCCEPNSKKRKRKKTSSSREDEDEGIKKKKKNKNKNKKKRKKMDVPKEKEICFLKIGKENIRKCCSPLKLGLSGKSQVSTDATFGKKEKSTNKPIEDKLKNIQVCKTTSKCSEEHPPSPIHRILNKETSLSDDLTNSCCLPVPKVKKRVNFSDKHVIIEEEHIDLSPIMDPRTKNAQEVLGSIAAGSRNIQPQLESLPSASDKVVAVNEWTVASSAANKVALVNEIVTDTVTCSMNEIGIQSIQEKEPLVAIEFDVVRPAGATRNGGTYQEKGKSPSDESVSVLRNLQHHVGFEFLSQGNSKNSHNSTCAVDSGHLNCAPEYRLNQNIETQMGLNLTDANRRASNSFQRSHAMDLLSNANLNPLSYTPAMNTEADRRHPFLSQSSSRHFPALQYPPFHQSSPKDIMAYINSSHQKHNTAAVLGFHSSSQDFVGLPLNSHGELVKLHSIEKGGFSKLRQQNKVTSPNDKFFLSPDQTNAKEEAFHPARIDIAELQEAGSREVIMQDLTGNNQSECLLDLDLNLMNICNGNQIGTERIKRGENSDTCLTLPTMRLMGKYVTVGKNNQTEAAIHPICPQSNSPTLRGLAMDTLNPRIFPTCVNQQAHFTPRSTGNQSVQKQPFFSPPHPASLTYGNQDIPQSRIWECESQNRYQRLPPTYTQLMSNQTLDVCTTPRSHACQECVEPSRSQGSSQKMMPHWMLNAKKQTEPIFSSPQLRSDTSAKNKYCPLSHSDLSENLHPFFPSKFPHPDCLATQSSSGAVRLAQRPLIPVPPGFRSNSALRTNCGRGIKPKEKVKLQCVEDKARKRPEHRTVAGLTKCSHDQQMEVASSAVMRLDERACTSFTCNTGATKHMDKGKGTQDQNSSSVILEERSNTSSVVHLLSADEVARSGPIKLSAGTKHILKPSRNGDQDNSKPTHSTIPLGSVTKSGIVSDIQNKSTKVYRL